MKPLFSMLVVTSAGLLTAGGIWRVALGLSKSDAHPPRQRLAIPAAYAAAGLGLSLWILLPSSLGRVLALVAGLASGVVASYLTVIEARSRRDLTVHSGG